MGKQSLNVQTVLQILEDEKKGDVKSALEKMTADYAMTWVFQAKDGELFPRTKNDMQAELDEVYTIVGRNYDIKHVTESADTVMVELIESYPDPKTGKVYKTPLVLVLEMEDGKIRRGRHYCDPRVSHLDLSAEQLARIFE